MSCAREPTKCILRVPNAHATCSMCLYRRFCCRACAGGPTSLCSRSLLPLCNQMSSIRVGHLGHASACTHTGTLRAVWSPPAATAASRSARPRAHCCRTTLSHPQARECAAAHAFGSIRCCIPALHVHKELFVCVEMHTKQSTCTDVYACKVSSADVPLQVVPRCWASAWCHACTHAHIIHTTDMHMHTCVQSTDA